MTLGSDPTPELTPDLKQALHGRNTLPAPALNSIVPEVRTMLRFVSVPRDDIERNVGERPGSHAVMVAWHFQSRDDAGMVALLREMEPVLARVSRPGITYLGTYRKLISEIDSTPHFVTHWGLASLDTLGSIGVFPDEPLRALYNRFIALVDHPTLSQAIYSLAVLSQE